jgi:hypothetical protein
MQPDYKLVGFRLAIGTLGHRRLDHLWAHDVYPNAFSGIFSQVKFKVAGHQARVTERRPKICEKVLVWKLHREDVYGHSYPRQSRNLPFFTLPARLA